MKTLLIAGMLLAASVLRAATDTNTFESLQAELRQKLLPLATQDNLSQEQLLSMMSMQVKEVFGRHPDALRKETEKQFAKLPVFKKDDLRDYEKVETVSEFDQMKQDPEFFTLAIGHNPQYLAVFVKMPILARAGGPQALMRVSTLGTVCPDVVYRTADKKSYNLILQSFTDLYFIRTEMTPGGVLKPLSVDRMRKKDTPAAAPSK